MKTQIETFGEPFQKLTKDLKDASKTLTSTEARFFVDYYYILQDIRKSADNQVRALSGDAEPHQLIQWLAANSDILERNVRSALQAYADAQLVGKWSQSIVGIGPVISAALLAYIDITKAPTVGHIWRYAGLDPTDKWLGQEKAAALVDEVMGDAKAVTPEIIAQVAQKINRRPEVLTQMATDEDKINRKTLTNAVARRPWNAQLKTLCWKIGESFVKVSNHDKDIYGKVYQSRKAEETAKNDQLAYQDQAKQKLAETKIGKNTDAYAAYSVGKLPPARIHLRAQRYAVKLFLSAWHEVAYYNHFKKLPPKPYAIDQLKHAHYIEVPNLDMVPGLLALKHDKAA